MGAKPVFSRGSLKRKSHAKLSERTASRQMRKPRTPAASHPGPNVRVHTRSRPLSSCGRGVGEQGFRRNVRTRERIAPRGYALRGVSSNFRTRACVYFTRPTIAIEYSPPKPKTASVPKPTNSLKKYNGRLAAFSDKMTSVLKTNYFHNNRVITTIPLLYCHSTH